MHWAVFSRKTAFFVFAHLSIRPSPRHRHRVLCRVRYAASHDRSSHRQCAFRVPSGLFFEAEAVHAVVHHARGESELAAGGGEIAVVLADGVLQDLAFVVGEQDFERGGIVAEVEPAWRRGGIPHGLERGRQVLCLDTVVGGGEDGALHAVFELADVSRPAVVHEQVDRAGRKLSDRLVVLHVQVLDEILGEQDDVALALGERRHHDGKDVQTVVQVLAEKLLLHQLLEVAAGGGEEAHVGMQLLVAADAREGAFLQEAQEFDLSLHGQVADLVEEERAAVRGFGASDASADRARERAFFVSEELAFDEIFGEGGAVQRDERLVLARGELDDGACEEFLSGAAGASDQDSGVGRRDLAELFVDELHLAAVSDHLAGRLLEHAAELAVFLEEGFAFVVDLHAGGRGVGGDVRDDLKERDIAVEVGLGQDGPVDGERADHVFVVDQRDADEGDLLGVMARAGAVQEPTVVAEVGDHMALSGLGDVPGDALADAVVSELLLGFGESAGDLDLQGVAVEKGERAPDHAHVAFEDCEDAFEERLHVAFTGDDRADLLDDEELRAVDFFHDAIIYMFGRVLSRGKLGNLTSI